MKVNYLTSLAAATVLLLSAASVRAEESAVAALAADTGAAPPAPSSTASVAPAAMPTEETATYYNDSDPVRDFVTRAGGWWVHQTGSPSKVDEYQDRNSSVFWGASGIMSAGDRTLDFDLYQSDDLDQYARLRYYGGPRLEADFMWEQFPHQLDQHDFAGWNYMGLNNTAGPAFSNGGLIHASGPTNLQNPSSIVFYTQNNLAPNGQDYAIAVQEFKANFKGELTENLSWRINVFGIDKEGVRQANEFQHCSAAAGNGSNLPTALPPGGVLLPPYPPLLPPAPAPTSTVPPADTNLTSQCHVTTQAQHIDWETDEVTASLHLKMGPDTSLEYQHLARQFTANDQNVTFNYDTAVGSYSPNPSAISALPFAAPATAAQQLARQAAINNLTTGYAIVPDTQTQIDRLKFTTKIGANTDAYLLGYGGYNEDEFRDTYRNFQGTDLRITNKSLETHTMTAYAKYYHEDTTNPTFALSQTSAANPTVAANDFYQEASLAYFTPVTVANNTFIGPEINRQLTAFGIDDRWCPFQDDCSIFASRLAIVSDYEYSSLKRQNAEYVFNVQPAGETGPFYGNNTFTQPDTDRNTWVLGVEEKWTCNFNTFLRYKYIETTYPLYGVTNNVGYQIAYALNSNMPTQENRIELGGTWTPSDRLMINATIYVENAFNNAFNNTPGFTPWTSNSVPFTFSAWWSATPDWSFTFGASEMDSWINQTVNLSNLNANGPVLNLPWKYVGTADVLTLGGRYQATCKLSFTGMFEWVRGMDENFAAYAPTSQVGGSWSAYGGAPASVSLGQYSLVKMDSYRLELGADYRITPRVTSYLRFDYYDYEDGTGLMTGQQNMVLGGISATF